MEWFFGSIGHISSFPNVNTSIGMKWFFGSIGHIKLPQSRFWPAGILARSPHRASFGVCCSMEICDACVCDIAARKRFIEWIKKYEKLEGLQVEFEVGESKLAPFLAELNEKLAHMLDFKKQYQKATFLTDALLKKKVDHGYYKRLMGIEWGTTLMIDEAGFCLMDEAVPSWQLKTYMRQCSASYWSDIWVI